MSGLGGLCSIRKSGELRSERQGAVAVPGSFFFCGTEGMSDGFVPGM